MREPITRNNATAMPLHVVDGAARGPDGRRLSSFASFADFVRGQRGVEAVDTATIAGAIFVFRDDGTSATIADDGTVTEIPMMVPVDEVPGDE